MSLYYQDDHVTLYHGDSLEILPTLDIEARALLTDPPYFKVKDEPWDNQWKKPEQFLAWLGDFLDLAKPLVAANGSVWVFASPQMTTRVELLVGGRFNVLNSIRWVKSQGWHNKTKVETLRSFLTPWEGIIFAEQYHDTYEDMSLALAREVFSPLGNYLKGEWEAAGWKAGEVGRALGRSSALIAFWAKGRRTPTEGDYARLKSLLGGTFLPKEYAEVTAWRAELRQEFEERRRQFEALRRPFAAGSRGASTDIWNFGTVPPYPGKHPCEKPQDMLRHMIQCSTREGDTVLDPFAGSGATLLAAKSLGRKAVGIEMNEKYCEQIVKTLTTQPEQLTFEFTA